MANDGEIKIGTKIDESGLDKGLKNVKGKVNNAAKDMNKGAKAASSFTQKMGGIATSGVAAAAGIAGAVVAAANLIASQIVLSADQLNIAGKTVFTSTKTASAISTAQEAAAKDAKSKADTAQTNAEKTAASQRNEMAQKMGYSSYDDMVNKAAKGQTIIDGGYLRTSLIEVEKLLAQSITMKDGGSLQSANYKAGKAGWKISSNGSVEFSSGTFRGDLVGGKVYFSALGLYGLKPGDIENDVVFTASKNSSARFVFDCFNSTVRIRMSASATSLADGECEIDFYMKENGSVGQYNFDGTANITWSKKGTQSLTKSFDVAAYEPGQYVEVMFKVSSATAGVGFNSVKAEVRLDEKNKYLPLCVDVIKL